MNMIKPAVVFTAIMLAACGNPSVVLETDLGDIQIEVYEDKAPLSAGDFLYHVDNGLYDGEGFYRVVRPDNDPLKMGMSLIQGGLLSTTPVTPSINHEPTNMTGLTHNEGAISIAREEVGSGSAAYFFITIGDNRFLDHGGARNPDGQGYAVFGKVTKGMDIVKQIQAMDSAGPSVDSRTKGQFLPKPAMIRSAKRL